MNITLMTPTPHFSLEKKPLIEEVSKTLPLASMQNQLQHAEVYVPKLHTLQVASSLYQKVELSSEIRHVELLETISRLE
jgi:hypothetical protein